MAEGDAVRKPSFGLGCVVGVVLMLLLVLAVWFVRRGEYVCMVWAEPGETVQCHMRDNAGWPFNG